METAYAEAATRAGINNTVTHSSMEPRVSDATLPLSKRKRKANWTHDDTMCLVQLYKDYASVLSASFKKPGVTHELKKETWDKITQQVNIVSAEPRSAEEVIKRWGTVLNDTNYTRKLCYVHEFSLLPLHSKRGSREVDETQTHVTA